MCDRPNNYGLASKATYPLFFKVIQYDYETFQNVVPILHSVICLRWILLQLQTKACDKKEKGSHKIMLSLETVTFIVKRFYDLLYNPICVFYVF